MVHPLAITTIALQGATVGVSCQLAVQCLFRKQEKNVQIKIGKFFLGFCMAIKSVLFLSFHASQWDTCTLTGRFADFFYHLAMTAGNQVLVTRVQSIIPFAWKSRALIFHSTLTVLRFLIGVVDVALIHLNYYDDGTCQYFDEEFWGPVYTLYDTVVDFYVTLMISMVLISHIRSITSTRMKVNTLLYTSVIYNNVLRTLCITIVNLMSTLLIIMVPGQHPVHTLSTNENKMKTIMLLWPIINIIFVVLVGYDSDVTKAIQKIRQRHWQTLSTTATSATLDLNEFPSLIDVEPSQQQEQLYRQQRKPSMTRRHSDPAVVDSSLDNDLERSMSANSLSATSHWKSVTPLTATTTVPTITKVAPRTEENRHRRKLSSLSDYNPSLLHNLQSQLSNTSSLRGSTSNNTVDSYEKMQTV